MSKIIRQKKVRDTRNLIRPLMQKMGRPFVVYIYKIMMSRYERIMCNDNFTMWAPSWNPYFLSILQIPYRKCLSARWGTVRIRNCSCYPHGGTGRIVLKNVLSARWHRAVNRWTAIIRTVPPSTLFGEVAVNLHGGQTYKNFQRLWGGPLPGSKRADTAPHSMGHVCRLMM